MTPKAGERESLAQGCLAIWGAELGSEQGPQPELFPDYFTCPDSFNLGESCRITVKDGGVNHTGGCAWGSGEEGSTSSRLVGPRGVTLLRLLAPPGGRFGKCSQLNTHHCSVLLASGCFL